jgi:hypothetical protein
LWLLKEQFALADTFWSPPVLIDLYPPVLSFLFLTCPHWSVFGDYFLSLSSQYSFLSLQICVGWCSLFLILPMSILALTNLFWVIQLSPHDFCRSH